MKTNLKILLSFALFVVFLIFISNQNSITGYVTLSPDSSESSIKLGYCPTLIEEATEIAESQNYELVEFNSAANVLQALKQNKIDKALIGRKAKISEISENTKETTIQSGIALISKERSSMDYSEINSAEIHTYLQESLVFQVLGKNPNIIYYKSKQDTSNLISQGKNVLISWDDWQDDFELVLVLEKGAHVKDFRGVFLYETQ